MTLSPNRLAFTVRFMNGRDREEVLRIDRACYTPAISAEELGDMLANRESMAMIADHQDEIVGYVLYHLLPTKIIIERVAVQPEFVRLGVGKRLVQAVTDKLSFTGRTHVETLTSEYNTRGHLFLQACGFAAIAVLKDYLEQGHDAYLFETSL